MGLGWGQHARWTDSPFAEEKRTEARTRDLQPSSFGGGGGGSWNTDVAHLHYTRREKGIRAGIDLVGSRRLHRTPHTACARVQARFWWVLVTQVGFLHIFFKKKGLNFSLAGWRLAFPQPLPPPPYLLDEFWVGMQTIGQALCWPRQVGRRLHCRLVLGC